MNFTKHTNTICVLTLLNTEKKISVKLPNENSRILG